MGPILIIVVAIIYTGVAIDAAIKKDFGTCIAYSGYAFSNIGLYMLAAK